MDYETVKITAMTTDDFPVFPAAFFSGLVTQFYYESWDFYTTHLGFRTIEEHNDWVRLMHPSGAQLILLQEEADHTPSNLVSACEGRGHWLTLEVADPAAERIVLESAGLTIDDVPSDKWWREGSYAVTDPNGVLVIITRRASLVKATKCERSVVINAA